MLALFRWRGNLLDIQTAAFLPGVPLWPTAAVMVKRLHDRKRSGAWALLMILACWPENCDAAGGSGSSGDLFHADPG